MTRTAIHALLFAGIVLLAGCTGGLTGIPESSKSDVGQTGEPTATPTDAGTVAFYISDEENAIGDFQQLEVTVTRVGFERAAADGGGWVEFDVDNETVDLTQVQGDNATLVDEFDLPNGTYTKVFVHVSDVNGTLSDGTQVTVKLPSNKLQIKKRFSVDNGSTIDYVFDITVHKAGQSGKYILTPVISESGTDVPINAVGESDDGAELSVELVGNVSKGGNATIAVIHDGESVENATVSVDDTAVGTTDSDGRLTFDLPDENEVEITAKKGDMEGELELEFTDEGEENEQDL